MVDRVLDRVGGVGRLALPRAGHEMPTDGAREPIDRTSPFHPPEENHPPALASAADVDLLAWVEVGSVHAVTAMQYVRTSYKSRTARLAT